MSQPQPDGAPAAWEPPDHWQYLDLAKLDEWQVAPLEPIVDGMIARGNLVLVAGETQTGKSLLCLNLARRLVLGGEFFGRYAVTPVPALLYLVLEDPGRRLRDRLTDMNHEFASSPRPDPGACVFYVAPGFQISDGRMFAWLEDVIEAEGREVVFLDTYQKATPGISSYADEEQSRILHALADLTRRLGVTLIVIDHIRKGPAAKHGRREISIDDVKGTGGKAQNADCVILMERTNDREQIRFQCYSKDFDPPIRVLLDVAAKGSAEVKFSYAGDLERLGSSARERGEATKLRILEALRPGEWYASSDLAQTLNLGKATICRHLNELIDEGSVSDNDARGRARRYWRLVSPTGNVK